MNFTDFNKDIAKEFGLSQDKSKKLLSFLQKQMEKKLKFGTQIGITNIGVLILKVRKPGLKHNLQTGKLFKTPRSYYLSLRVSKVMNAFLKTKTVYGYDDSQK